MRKYNVGYAVLAQKREGEDRILWTNQCVMEASRAFTIADFSRILEKALEAADPTLKAGGYFPLTISMTFIYEIVLEDQEDV